MNTENATIQTHPTVDELTAKLVKFSGSGQINDFEDDCGLWKSKMEIKAEGPVFLFIRMVDMQEAEFTNGHKWGAEIIAASPFFATDASICNALSSNGDWMEERWDEFDSETRVNMLCETLMEHGTQVILFSKTSPRAIGPFRACFNELSKISMLFGFYADQQKNAMGDDGWSFLRGTYGFSGKKSYQKPTAFQRKVLRWLNDHYEARRAFNALPT